MLKRYCILDERKEFAIVVELPTKHLVGVARATIIKRGIAEVAVVVTDKYQRQGIGKKIA
ncbi:MAG: GNAT family N-acetyltransferase [Candidatus Diapherotrites archaeon]|nr:GNAT family N-acetyltransferase [Candidatus Diapherotrites archaeon]